MQSKLIISEINDGVWQTIHISSDEDGSTDIFQKVHGILSSEENLTSVKLDYMPRSNYFGLEFKYDDNNGTSHSVTCWTKDISDAVKISQIINLIN